MTNWKPGMKAVCVERDVAGMLLIGWIYTITLIEDHGCGPSLGVGIMSGSSIGRCVTCNQTFHNRKEHTYRTSRFRPLLSDEQEALDRIEQEVKETEPKFA